MALRRCAVALLLQVAVAVWLCSAAVVGGLWLSIPASGTKCVSEEIHANIVVLADYTALYEDPSTELPTISIKVTSPLGSTIHHQENVTTGQFAFTTTESGTYLACFRIEGLQNKKEATLNLEWRTGVAAKDWDAVAKKEKIEGVELDLRRLEVAVESIHENLLHLRDRESEMRMVSEKTNARVAWFSMMSLGVCIVASALQLLHLKSFFQKKRLI